MGEGNVIKLDCNSEQPRCWDYDRKAETAIAVAHERKSDVKDLSVCRNVVSYRITKCKDYARPEKDFDKLREKHNRILDYVPIKVPFRDSKGVSCTFRLVKIPRCNGPVYGNLKF